MKNHSPVSATLSAHDVESYLSGIFNLTKKMPHVRCYRGEANAAWDLKPSITRGLKPEAESQILSELLLEVPGEFTAEKSMFDKLVKAQHYGLPTRLLDVSLNPLVALYFACADPLHAEEDGAVRILDFSSRRVKFADSDTVSLICNLARLSDNERTHLYRQRTPSRRWNKKDATAFRKLKPMNRLLQFIRIEKPYFLDKAKPGDLFKYFFVHPAKANRRVIAQSGAFVAAGLLEYRTPEKSKELTMTKIDIAAAHKLPILKQLDILNINSRSLFPEIEFASKYIKEKWRI
ncbi:FRG domain-containing protein [Pseudomonas sp. KBS0710]|uniref:FRG domain-containing protein n=1 Tax=Pseudomonas sp. KBS0710 TaxID=1179667 RepID=UPI00110E320A|nr:FRG domain-containing protein [Pseudomonas sp. KBS0710]TSD78967.1 FRG domain-containing protein [Pseudomonas sp. KBS0710]